MNKNNYFSFRVDDSEKKKIDQKIKKSKLKKSDFLRKTVLEKEIIVVDGLRELFIEIKKQGTNLNQITRAINSGSSTVPGNLEEVKEEYKKLNELIGELVRKV